MRREPVQEFWRAVGAPPQGGSFDDTAFPPFRSVRECRGDRRLGGHGTCPGTRRADTAGRTSADRSGASRPTVQTVKITILGVGDIYDFQTGGFAS
jgi:hypothetical protein